MFVESKLKKSINKTICIVLLICISLFYTSVPSKGEIVEAKVIYVQANQMEQNLQSIINSASPGSIIVLPEGEFQFSSNITINKSLVLKGESTEKTVFSLEGWTEFRIRANDVRIQDIKFIGYVDWDDSSDMRRAIDIGNCQNFCIINCEFIDSGYTINIIGDDAKGVISNCIFRGCRCGVAVYGDEGSSWDEQLKFGMENGDNAVFVEDCFFDRTIGIGSNNGSKYVFRYNEFIGDSRAKGQCIDVHGLEWSGYSHGSRSYEIYNNIIHHDSNHFTGIWIRGGDGVIFDNDINDCSPAIMVSHRTTPHPPTDTYPGDDQTRALYAWGNTLNGQPVDVHVRSNHEYLLQEGRDFFNYEMPEYTPYTYPHPLTVDLVIPEPESWDSKAVISEGIHTFGTENEGRLTAEFDFVPNVDDINGLIGYADSDIEIAGEDSLFISISTLDGELNAIDGDEYKATNQISYTEGEKYHIKIQMDFDTKKYDVWVTPENGSEVQLADKFSFRVDTADDLGQICLKSESDEDFTVIGHIVFILPPEKEADWIAVSSFTDTDGLYVFDKGYEGEVEIEYDFIPYEDEIDGVLGFAGYGTNITAFSNLYLMFRANTSGSFDAFNKDISFYTATNSVPYEMDNVYHVKMIINTETQRYSVWVTPEGESEVLLADNFPYRVTDQPGSVNIGRVFFKCATGQNEQFGVNNMEVTATEIPDVTPTPTPGVSPTPLPAGILLMEDFNDSIADDWEIKAGTWLVSNGEYRQTNSYQNRAVTYYKTDESALWADYTYSADVKVDSDTKKHGLIFRCDSTGENYYVLRTNGRSTIEFGRVTPNYGALKTYTFDMSQDGYYKFTAITEGNEITLKVNDTTLGVVTNTLLSAGTVGFYSSGTISTFDNVLVSSPDEETPILAESVTISEDNITMTTGDEMILTATVSPENAINKELVWTSSDESVATIDADGAEVTVNALSPGATTITARVVDTEITGTCIVTVIPEQEEETAITITGPSTVNGLNPFKLIYSVKGMEGITAQQVIVSYTKDLFDFTGVNPLDEGEEYDIWDLEVDDDKEAGVVTIILASPNSGITGDADILELEFIPKAGGAGTITIAARLGDFDGAIIPTQELPLLEASISIEVSMGKAVLESAIDTAQAIYDEAVEGILPGLYPAGTKSRLSDAIDAAVMVVNDENATEQQISDAIDALNAAVAKFQGMVITIDTGDVNDNPGIDIGDLAKIAGLYGKKSEDTGWDDNRHMDINDDGEIGLYELAFIARRLILK